MRSSCVPDRSILDDIPADRLAEIEEDAFVHGALAMLFWLVAVRSYIDVLNRK